MDRVLEKKPFYRRRRFWFYSGGGAVLFVLILLIMLDTGSKLNVDAEKITISTVADGDFQEFIPVSGTILPRTTFYLDAILGGVVAMKYVEEGAMLKKGDKILQLSNTNLQLNALQQETFTYQQINDARNTRLQIEQNSNALQNALVAANHGLTNAGQIYARQQAMWERKLISEQEFQQTENNYHLAIEQQALAQQNFSRDSVLKQNQLQQIGESIDRLQKNLELIREELNNLTIRAPISGQLTTLNGETGQSKSPGDQLGQIDAIDGFKVRADIDEFYIARVKKGLHATVEIDSKNYSLIVTKVYPAVTAGKFQVDMEFSAEGRRLPTGLSTLRVVDDSSSGSLPVRQAPTSSGQAGASGGDGAVPEGIRRGQTLQIRLQLSERTKALLLPRGGFYQKTGGQWVFALDPSGSRAARKSISLGRQNPDYFEVLKGLAPGDRVVTSSYDNFGDVNVLMFK